jgi:hypothetical protein
MVSFSVGAGRRRAIAPAMCLPPAGTDAVVGPARPVPRQMRLCGGLLASAARCGDIAAVERLAATRRDEVNRGNEVGGGG